MPSAWRWSRSVSARFPALPIPRLRPRLRRAPSRSSRCLHPRRSRRRVRDPGEACAGTEGCSSKATRHGEGSDPCRSAGVSTRRAPAAARSAPPSTQPGGPQPEQKPEPARTRATPPALPVALPAVPVALPALPVALPALPVPSSRFPRCSSRSSSHCSRMEARWAPLGPAPCRCQCCLPPRCRPYRDER